MVDINPLLQQLASDLEPSPAQLRGARRSHAYLREALVEGRIPIQRDFLIGSYARDTAIQPLDDVDIVFVVDPAHWKDRFWSWGPAPAAVLDTFARSIRYRYESSSVRIQRRSVGLLLNHVQLDLVPAIAHPRDPKLLRVADTSSGNWIDSGPQKHAELAVLVNKKRQGDFKPLVKLLKYWNTNLPDSAHLKSFAIETIATRLFDVVALAGLADGLRSFWDYFAAWGEKPTRHKWRPLGMQFSSWTRTVPDTAGTGSNLVAGVDGARRGRFIEHAVRARDRIEDAERARSEDKAREYLNKAFRA
jgi:hypothetical protein